MNRRNFVGKSLSATAVAGLTPVITATAHGQQDLSEEDTSGRRFQGKVVIITGTSLLADGGMMSGL